MSREEVLRAVRELPASQDFQWNGVDEEDRPATAAELAAAAQARRGPGRPVGSGAKEQVAIRIDRDVLAAFRAQGPGWQTRINAVLREAVRTGKI